MGDDAPRARWALTWVSMTDAALTGMILALIERFHANDSLIAELRDGIEAISLSNAPLDEEQINPLIVYVNALGKSRPGWVNEVSERLRPATKAAS